MGGTVGGAKEDDSVKPKAGEGGNASDKRPSQQQLEDFICAILDEAIELRNADAAAQESVRDLINDAYKK